MLMLNKKLTKRKHVQTSIEKHQKQQSFCNFLIKVLGTSTEQKCSKTSMVVKKLNHKNWKTKLSPRVIGSYSELQFPQ